MRRALASAAATAAICTLALAVCCALIASADLRKSGSSLLEVGFIMCGPAPVPCSRLRTLLTRPPLACDAPIHAACATKVVPLGSIMAPRRILYGLGSGEEQDAANQNAVAWGSFADQVGRHAYCEPMYTNVCKHAHDRHGCKIQDAYAHDLLGADHYAVQFDEALNSDAVSLTDPIAGR